MAQMAAASQVSWVSKTVRGAHGPLEGSNPSRSALRSSAMAEWLILAYGGDGSGIQLWWVIAGLVGIPLAAILTYTLLTWLLGWRDKRR